MRIVHVISTLNAGGAEKLIFDSIPLYGSFGFSVDVIVLKTTNSFLLEELKKKVTVIELTKGSVYNPLNIIKLKAYLVNYDLAHLHLFPVLYWGVLAKIFFRLKVPLVYTEHSTNNKRRNNFVFGIIDRFMYNKLAFVGCISEGTKKSLKKHLGITSLNIETINNGIDVETFQNITSLRGYFSENDFVLVQVSSFRVQKDQKTLIRSLKYLDDRIKLILVGDGNLRKDCEFLVTELRLNNRVLFLGIRSDIPQILSQSDVVILSSNIEGFGLAIVEGMAAGKPVIASNIDGLKEVVEGFGLLFERGDERDLANNIQNLYNNKPYYDKIAGNCLRRAKDFDIRNMVGKYSHIYKKVINENIANNH